MAASGIWGGMYVIRGDTYLVFFCWGDADFHRNTVSCSSKSSVDVKHRKNGISG